MVTELKFNQLRKLQHLDYLDMAEEVFLRRTELAHAPGIAQLVDSDTAELFGDLSLVTVM